MSTLISPETVLSTPTHGRSELVDRRLNRLGASAGLLYVVLVLVGVNAFPKGNAGILASQQEIARDVAARPADAGFWTGIFLEGLGLLVLIFFLARLWDVLRSAEGRSGWLSMTALGAGLVSVAVKLASFPLGTVAFYEVRDGGLDPQLAATLIHANDISFVATWAIDAVFLAATAATALRTGALPRWAGWSAAAIAPLMLAAVAIATSDSAQLPTALFLIWIVGVSIRLMRRPDGVAEARSAGMPRAQPILR
jgi:hypothetical protein